MRKGLTLIEVLVVVAIIGILSAIISGAIGQARQKQQVSEVPSGIRAITLRTALVRALGEQRQ